MKLKKMAFLSQLFLASTLVVLLSHLRAVAQEEVVYASDLANGIDSAWSGEGADEGKIIGDGDMLFLGELFGEELSLKVNSLSDHEMVKISFDLAIVRSWDGDSPTYGPDRILLHLDQERMLMDATFANKENVRAYGEFSQSYPGVYPFECNPPLSGANNQNGSRHLAPIPNTEGEGFIYHVEFCVPHSADSVEFTFQGMPTEPEAEQLVATNECWGIGNVKVATLAHPPVTINQERFDELWQQIGAPDAVTAHAALWELASAGEGICEFIANTPALSTSTNVELIARIEQLILELDNDSYQIRENASAELGTISSMELLPIIHEKLQQDVPAEVQIRLEALQALHSQEGDIRSVLHSRLRHLLHVIGGEQAEALRARVSEPVPAVPDSGSPAEGPGEIEWGEWGQPLVPLRPSDRGFRLDRDHDLQPRRFRRPAGAL